MAGEVHSRCGKHLEVTNLFTQLVERKSVAARGVFCMAQAACESLRLPVGNARVAVHGFGKTGSAAALLLAGVQAVIAGVSDTRGAIYFPRGLDIPRLIEHKERSGSVVGFPGAEPITGSELLALDCDILILSALACAVRGLNAPTIRARIVAEAAEGSITPHGDSILDANGVLVIPDILANAGGAEHELRRSFHEVLRISVERKVNLRGAANMLGIGRAAAAAR